MKSASSIKRLVLLGSFLAAFLVVLNVSTYVLYTRSKDYLDAELGERLRSIAVTLSYTVEISTAGVPVAENIEPQLKTMLHAARVENLLSNIVILTPDGRTVLDLDNVSIAGEPNPFIELDFTAVTLARSGLSAYTSLYKSGDLYMKSAYAPVVGPNDGVTAIVGVEAGAAYFDVLRSLSSAILVVDIASIIIIVILGIIFYHQSLALERAHTAVIQGENLATMGRMIAGIAHEIRNPLSIIGTSAERLQRRYGTDDEVFSYITEEVEKLNDILTGYLDFAMARSQELRPASLQKIVHRCLVIIEPEIGAKTVDVVNNLPESEVMIRGDDKRIQQAVLNVLLNAIQANATGGRIEISLDESREYAVLVIKDTGEGIEAKNLKDVTRPFFTTKERGSGLGMSIVQTILAEHNGSLAIRSNPDTGTEVSLSIPLAS